MPPKRRGGARSKPNTPPASKAQRSPSPDRGTQWRWFEVEDIVDESENQYFVRWSSAERDPVTGARFPDEWIDKECANSRLIADWEAKKTGLPISKINPDLDINQSSQAYRNVNSSESSSERQMPESLHRRPIIESSPVSSSMPLSMALESSPENKPDTISVNVPRFSQVGIEAEDYRSQAPTQYRQGESSPAGPAYQTRQAQRQSASQSNVPSSESNEESQIPSSSAQVSQSDSNINTADAEGLREPSQLTQVEEIIDDTTESNQESSNIVQDSQKLNRDSAEDGPSAANDTAIDQTTSSSNRPEQSLATDTSNSAPEIIVSEGDTAMLDDDQDPDFTRPSEIELPVASISMPAPPISPITPWPQVPVAIEGAIPANESTQPEVGNPESTRRKRFRDLEEEPGSPAKRQRSEVREPAEQPAAPIKLGGNSHLTSSSGTDSRSSINPVAGAILASQAVSSSDSHLPQTIESNTDLEMELEQKVQDLEAQLAAHRAHLSKLRVGQEPAPSNIQIFTSQTYRPTMPTDITSPAFIDFATQQRSTIESSAVRSVEDGQTTADTSPSATVLQQQLDEQEASVEQRFQQLIAGHKAAEETLRHEVQRWKAYHAATESDYGKLMKEHLTMEQEHRASKAAAASLTKQMETLQTRIQTLNGVVAKLKDDLKQEVASSKTKLAEAREAASVVPEVAQIEAMKAEVDAAMRKLTAGQRDIEFIRDQYQQASTAAVESKNTIIRQEEELKRLRSKADGEIVKLRAMYEEGHMQKERDNAQKAIHRSKQLERSLMRANEEILEYKKKEAAKGMAAFTRASSNLGSRPASRAVSRRPASPGPSQLGPGSQRAKPRNGTPKIG